MQHNANYRLVVEAGKRGVLIMLDQHRLDPARGISDLWCVRLNVCGWMYVDARFPKTGQAELTLPTNVSE